MQQHQKTSFDARWKTDSKVDQPVQRTKLSECYSNTIHTCESIMLRCYIEAECSSLYAALHLALDSTEKSPSQAGHFTPRLD
jgi:hypothetical protein